MSDFPRRGEDPAGRGEHPTSQRQPTPTGRGQQQPARHGSAHHARAEHDGAERGLRGLIGPGSSQVSVSAALRARDAARPTEADLAAAEATVHIVRRNWVPPEALS